MDIVVLGDIHGCSRFLENALSKLRGSSIRNIYCVGDCISRGPDSFGVIQKCISHGVISVRGNHEDTFIKKIAASKTSGQFFLEESLAKLVVSDIMLYLAAMPLFILVDKILITHAGLPPDRFNMTAHELIKTLNKRQDSPSLFNEGMLRFIDYYLMYSKESNCKILDGYYQVFGHVVTNDPIITNQYASIDTGCGYQNGRLSGIIADSKSGKVKEVLQWSG